MMTEPRSKFQELLYGYNPMERIVSICQTGDGTMRAFSRIGDTVQHEDYKFYPFFFLSDSSFLQGITSKHWMKELSGMNEYRYLCIFTRWTDMWDAIHHVVRKYGRGQNRNVESYSDVPVLLVRPDAVSQFMMHSGMTLFKGMEFHELHRLQLDIETYTGHGRLFSNAQREEDRIIIISLADNRGWKHVISGKRLPEREMLEQLITLINEMDVDVIEGHNILNFDLTYILKRCELLGLEFSIGRGGMPLRSYETRTSFAERAVDYTGIDIPGRQIIDTWILLQAYDVSKRTLESYGLKYAAKHFGFATLDRIYIQPDRISWYWDNEHELLERYALDDVKETGLLSEHLSPGYFYLSRMLPFNYGTISRIGSSAKIESLLLREYVRTKRSVPVAKECMPSAGGYTDIFRTGVLGPILEVDVESLYPSIMLSEKITPRSEEAGIFLVLLEQLTQLRISAKRDMEQAHNVLDRSRLDALQSSFKILINSFYGYLGYNRGLFNDPAAADRITKHGQRILRHLMKAITARHGAVVEVDTDGIYFVPPLTARTEQTERRLVSSIAEGLPEGISLAYRGRYASMLSYKKKNYALLDYEGRVKIRGSSLTSRSMEKFGRHFVQQCVDALLQGNIQALHGLYVSVWHAVQDRQLSISDIARTETLKLSLHEYMEAVTSGERSRSSNYEVAIVSNLHWRPGDRISYYVTGNDANVRGFENCKLVDDWDSNFPDENIPYYLRRLQEFATKWEVFFTPADFRTIFSVEDLFPFSAAGISIRTRDVVHEAEDAGREEKSTDTSEPSIWLDDVTDQ